MKKVLGQNIFSALDIFEYACDCKPAFCSGEHWIYPPPFRLFFFFYKLGHDTKYAILCHLCSVQDDR